MPHFTNTPARPQTTEAYQSSCQIRRQKQYNNYEPRNLFQNSEPSSLRLTSVCEVIRCTAHSVNVVDGNMWKDDFKSEAMWRNKVKTMLKEKKSQILKKKNGMGGGGRFIPFPKNVSVRCMCCGYKLTRPCTGWDFAKDLIKNFHHQVFSAMQAKKQWIVGEETQIYRKKKSCTAACQ